MKKLSIIISMAAALLVSSASSFAQEGVDLVAKIAQSPGLRFGEPRGTLEHTRTINVYSDGTIYVSVDKSRGQKQWTDTNYFARYKNEDIEMFKRTISKLNPNRKLVEDDGPIMCDGGSVHYSIVIAGVETVIKESNDCFPGRSRAGAHWSENAVIKVLEDLLAFYWEQKRE